MNLSVIGGFLFVNNANSIVLVLDATVNTTYANNDVDVLTIDISFSDSPFWIGVFSPYFNNIQESINRTGLMLSSKKKK